MLYELIHHGVVAPEPPQPIGLRLVIRGAEWALTPKQEEMALAWARKKDTPYVQDTVFCANFLRDFGAELGLEPPLATDEVDWRPAYAYVDAERRAKEALSLDERKALALERKREREALRARYGYAIVNGQRVELGTYLVEPSSIFMGRGQHPLRGRWKEGARREEITLNVGPDRSSVGDGWAEVVWQPESLWAARWQDKLTGKLKYVWLSDTAPVKQVREAGKFDKAVKLESYLPKVRAAINQELKSEDARRRMLATVCYLIDALCLRVGDEKEADEADTVGATTLRPEHVTLLADGAAEFHFLGKDSVEWRKTIKLPIAVRRNLKELIAGARPSSSAANGEDANHPTRALPQLFPDVTSPLVNAFLARIMPGLSAKVFRTHHATQVVSTQLTGLVIQPSDPDYRKWEAASLANLEAAVLCNHTKQARGDPAVARERFEAQRIKGEQQLAQWRHEAEEAASALEALRQADPPTPERRIASAQRKMESAHQRVARGEIALGKLTAQFTIGEHKRTWNLGTSLKSYIDPRVYHRWGQRVGYDVLARYYPSTLQRKFAWVREDDQPAAESSAQVRTCMSSDLTAVAELFRAAGEEAAPDEIGAHYLPDLRADWREAIIAVGPEQQVVAFAALGPTWSDGEREYLDLFALLRPGADGAGLAAPLAREIERRRQTYIAAHPKAPAALRPSDPAWLDAAPELAKALGLAEGE